MNWWDMEIIKTDANTQLTSKEFQEGIYVRGLRLELEITYYQESNG